MTPLDRYIRRRLIGVAHQRLKRRQYLSRARATARAVGVCSRCAANPARPGLRSCVGCAETHRLYVAALRDAERAVTA